jgi:hypothetical protein
MELSDLYGPSINAWSLSSRIDVLYCSKMSIIAREYSSEKHRPSPILRHRRNGIKSCFSLADQLDCILAITADGVIAPTLTHTICHPFPILRCPFSSLSVIS